MYYPYIEGLEEGTCIDVHSKVTIVDDEWLRVGSANVCNRRNRLLAEHLGVAEERVTTEIDAQGSMSAPPSTGSGRHSAR